MDLPDFDRLAEILERVSLAPAGERAAIIDECCGDNAVLRAELLALLRHLDDSPQRVMAGGPSTGPAGAVHRRPLWLSPGDRLGRFRIERELGRGGQGIVYLAEDTRLGRRVALKTFVGTFLDSDDLRQRFEREALVASRLNHPGICAVHDFGTEDGVPYIAMQYLAGETLARRLTTTRDRLGTNSVSCVDLPSDPEAKGPARIDAVIAFIERVARSLHAAHEAGVVHRDVKPGNIMVQESGDPAVMDFGLARQDISGMLPLTRTGDIFGTPAYMSPEQLRPEGLVIDRRTDIWSLGVTLFECLTLRRPFESPTQIGLQNAILGDEPVTITRLNPTVPIDLSVVVQTALAKNRAQRYQTALDLAEDLRRVREREPIRARPVTALKRVVRWAQRNPRLAWSTGLALIFLFSGLAISLVLLDAARTSAAGMERAEAASERRSYRAHLAAAKSALDIHDALAARGNLDQAPPRWRGVEWRVLQAASDRSLWSGAGDLPAEFVAASRPSPVVTTRPTGSETSEVLDAADGRLLWVVNCIDPHMAADQRTLVGVPFGPRATRPVAYGWDARSGAERWRAVPPLAGDIRSVEQSADGRLAVLGMTNGSLVLWDIPHREVQAVLLGHLAAVTDVAFSADLRQVVSRDAGGTVKIWDARAEPAPFTVSTPFVDYFGAAIAPDGRRSVVNFWGGITAFDTQRGCEVWSCWLSRALASAETAYSPDGRFVVTATADRNVHVVDAASGRMTQRFGPMPGVVRLLFWAGSERLVGLLADGSLYSFAREGGDPQRVGLLDQVSALAIDPTGVTLAVGTVAGELRLTDLSTLATRWSTPAHQGAIRCVAFSSDGRQVASGGDDRVVTVHDLARGMLVSRSDEATAAVVRVVFDAPGARILAADLGMYLRVFDVESGQELFGMHDPTHTRPALALWWDATRILMADPTRPVIAFEAAASPAVVAARGAAQRARAEVNRRFGFGGQVAPVATVVADLERDSDLTGELRDRAIDIARARGDDLNRLNGLSWDACVAPPTPTVAAHALAMIDAVCAARPDEYDFLNARAIVLYRNGRFAEARAAAERCIALLQARRGRFHPIDLAVLAMSAARNGDAAVAQDAIARMRPLLTDPRYQADPDVQRLAEEAEHTMAR